MKKGKEVKTSDAELHAMAERIGTFCDLETVLHFMNAYMAKNYLTNMQFELVAPNALEKDPHWGFKYAFKRLEEPIKDGESDAK